ncbi:hypothetical protein I4U23_027819 [Adineta vaga]|nr:hypothetical protein I4U23_027819 [Adineta vaga]
MNFNFILVFISLIHSIDTVRILGLFPRYEDTSVDYSKYYPTNHWTFQTIAMFRAALTLADQYQIHINSTIIQTTSEGNGFTELDLICREIKDTSKSDIIGIIGPSASTKARFLATFAGHIGLPLISYAATNAELNDPLVYPTFYRTVPSDILLAEAIIQLFEYFKWKTCTLILTKDDYGYGGLKILSEIYHLNLTIKERLIFDPISDKFHVNMTKTLKKSQSRIVLIWANHDSSTRILQHAFNENLFDSSYVWLMTNKIDFNAFPSIHLLKLEGILAVIPIIDNETNENLRKQALNIWRQSEKDRDYFPDHISSLNPYAMYTFDAVWSLIEALNKSSSDHESPSMFTSTHCFDNRLINDEKYQMYLQNTHFFGVSGKVQFVKNISNDRFNDVSYALYNLQSMKEEYEVRKIEIKYVNIMIWYKKTRQWTLVNDKQNTDIIWPDENLDYVPTDYPQLQGKFVRIFVIEAPPFVIVRNISSENYPSNNFDYINFRSEPLKTLDKNILIYGFVADFIHELQDAIHFNYSLRVADPTTNYHSLVALLTHQRREHDMILSDIRITSNRLLTVDFSKPFHENTFRIIIRQNPYSSSTLFSCFNPFTWDVWIAILAVIIYSGIIIYFFECRNKIIENDQSRVKSILIGVCHALSSVIIMNADIRLTTNPSRLTVLGLYALGIILVATYTANLSSFLTLNRGQPLISGIDDIKNGRLPFSRIGIVVNSAVSDYYIQNIHSIYHPLSSAEEIYLRLLDHTIDAAIWDSSVLEYAVNNFYCNRLTVIGVGFVKSSFAVVLPKNWPYKTDLDVHILEMRESEKLDNIENTWLDYRQCSSTSMINSGRTNEPNIQIFSLDIMSGLFLTFLIITAIAFGVHLWYYRTIIIQSFCHRIQRMKSIVFLLMCIVTQTTASNSTQSISSYVSFVTPKIVPFLLGTYRFDTLESVEFPLDVIFPSTARKVNIIVFIRSGMNSYETAFNLWLWTECPEKSLIDTKFKRGYRYNQNAYSFDSETLEFSYCSSKPKLYAITDNQANNVHVELYAAGYTKV